MKAVTTLRVAEAIQLLQLDGYSDFTHSQLSNVSGISRKTLQRDPDLIQILNFALNRKEYDQCIAYI